MCRFVTVNHKTQIYSSSFIHKKIMSLYTIRNAYNLQILNSVQELIFFLKRQISPFSFFPKIAWYLYSVLITKLFFKQLFILAITLIFLSKHCMIYTMCSFTYHKKNSYCCLMNKMSSKCVTKNKNKKKEIAGKY